MDEVDGPLIGSLAEGEIGETTEQETETAAKLVKFLEDTLPLLWRGLIELLRWLIISKAAAGLEDLRPYFLVLVVDRPQFLGTSWFESSWENILRAPDEVCDRAYIRCDRREQLKGVSVGRF